MVWSDIVLLLSEEGMVSDPILEKEVIELRKEVLELRQQLGKKNKYGLCLVIMCVAIGVFVILPIMAAVAIPMYSTFKSKSKVSVALNSAMGTQTALQDWYAAHGNFENLSVPEEGGAITAGDTPTGAGLDHIENLSWRLIPNQDCIRIQFKWRSGCPPDTCDGFFELCCDGDECTTAGQVGGRDDPLAFNWGPGN